MTSQPQVSTFTIDKQNERTYLITNLWSSVYIPWKRLGCFHWENWSDTSFDLTVISLFEEWYVIRYISKDQTTNFELWLHWNLHTDTLSQICFGFDFDVFFFLHRIPECILVFLFISLVDDIRGEMKLCVIRKASFHFSIYNVNKVHILDIL